MGVCLFLCECVWKGDWKNKKFCSILSCVQTGNYFTNNLFVGHHGYIILWSMHYCRSTPERCELSLDTSKPSGKVTSFIFVHKDASGVEIKWEQLHYSADVEELQSYILCVTTVLWIQNGHKSYRSVKMFNLQQLAAILVRDFFYWHF